MEKFSQGDPSLSHPLTQRGRVLWPILQPATGAWSNCSGLFRKLSCLSCQPSLYTLHASSWQVLCFKMEVQSRGSPWTQVWSSPAGLSTLSCTQSIIQIFITHNIQCQSGAAYLKSWVKPAPGRFCPKSKDGFVSQDRLIATTWDAVSHLLRLGSFSGGLDPKPGSSISPVTPLWAPSKHWKSYRVGVARGNSSMSDFWGLAVCVCVCEGWKYEWCVYRLS